MGGLLGGNGPDDDLHSQGSGEAHYGGEAGVAVGGKGFIEAGPAHADLLSESAHVLGSGNVPQRCSDEGTIAGVIFTRDFDINLDIFCCLEVICDIPYGISFRQFHIYLHSLANS